MSKSHGISRSATIILFLLPLLATKAHAFLIQPNAATVNMKTVQRSSMQILFSVTTATTTHEEKHEHHPENRIPPLSNTVLSRRNALGVAASLMASIATWSRPSRVWAAEESDDPYVERGNGFAYRFVYPPDFEPGAKPVKTHLFEINWKSTNTPKYTFGITIDPVRINSLKEFGTPEEVAAKVVTAEVNRDGVFDVTLVKDPVAVEEDGVLSYILNYLSQGKRGDKRFVAKFCIQNQRLYALTSQVAEADYTSKEKELMKAVDSFRVLA